MNPLRVGGLTLGAVALASALSACSSKANDFANQACRELKAARSLAGGDIGSSGRPYNIATAPSGRQVTIDLQTAIQDAQRAGQDDSKYSQFATEVKDYTIGPATRSICHL